MILKVKNIDNIDSLLSLLYLNESLKDKKYIKFGYCNYTMNIINGNERFFIIISNVHFINCNLNFYTILDNEHIRLQFINCKFENCNIYIPSGFKRFLFNEMEESVDIPDKSIMSHINKDNINDLDFEEESGKIDQCVFINSMVFSEYSDILRYFFNSIRMKRNSAKVELEDTYGYKIVRANYYSGKYYKYIPVLLKLRIPKGARIVKPIFQEIDKSKFAMIKMRTDKAIPVEASIIYKDESNNYSLLPIESNYIKARVKRFYYDCENTITKASDLKTTVDDNGRVTFSTDYNPTYQAESSIYIRTDRFYPMYYNRNVGVLTFLDDNFVYSLNKISKSNLNYSNIITCTEGIHFFKTKEEALTYNDMTTITSVNTAIPTYDKKNDELLFTEY